MTDENLGLGTELRIKPTELMEYAAHVHDAAYQILFTADDQLRQEGIQ